MTQNFCLAILVLGILTACSGAEQKPEKRWDVTVSKASDARVWVSRSDGSKQCAENPPSLTPESATQSLKKRGVAVFQARTGNDGMIRTAVCGASTGNTVDLEISRLDLPKAQAQGYQLLPQGN